MLVLCTNHHLPQQRVQQQYGQNVTHNQGFSQHQSQYHQDQTGQFRKHHSQHQAQQQSGHNGAQNQHLHQHQVQLQSDHSEAVDILPSMSRLLLCLMLGVMLSKLTSLVLMIL
jgi:membrane-bound lytic murein transglycosylase